MPKIKLYQMLETIGTILWFCMDFCWMSKYQTSAWIFSFIAAGILFATVISCIIDNRCSRTELFIAIASFDWFAMNSCWMFAEDTNSVSLLTLAKFWFVIAAVFVIIATFMSHKYKERIDIKRLKIK